MRLLIRLAYLALLGLAACTLGSKPNATRETYLVDVPAPPQDATPLPGVLLVAGFEVAAAFADKQMVYRFEDHRYQSDYYNGFLVAPRDMIGQRTLEWLQRAHLFETVAPLSGARVPQALVLRASVNEMYADVRDAANPAAVLSMQLYITAEHTDQPPLRFAQQFRDVAPMQDASAQAYADALSRALEAILTQADRQIRESLADEQVRQVKK
jgi:cholesterol transport system auxiliary component